MAWLKRVPGTAAAHSSSIQPKYLQTLFVSIFLLSCKKEMLLYRGKKKKQLLKRRYIFEVPCSVPNVKDLPATDKSI